MCAVVFASRIEDWSNRSIFREEAFLALHCATIGIVVASQSGLSQSFRYILPCLPFVFIWASQAMQAGFKVCTFKGAVAAAGLISYIASSLSVSPHWGCHFSELVGGAVHGHECLDGASVDWGHSLWDLKKWLENHKEAVSVKIAVMSLYSPAHLGIFGDEPPHGPLMGAESSSGNSAELGPLPGWYAVSTDRLHSFSGEFAYFLEFEPVEKIGYSIFVYRISVDDANRVRRKMGLSDVQ